MPFGKLQVGCHVPFTEEWLSSGHSTIKAWLVECCRDGCPSVMFSHLHRGTLELCQSDHRVLDHLPDQGPSSQLLNLARLPALGRVLVVPTFLHKRMMADTVFWVTINDADIFWYNSSDVPWHNPVSEPYRQFLQPHGLVFALTCTINCGTIDRCVPFQIISNQFTLP